MCLGRAHAVQVALEHDGAVVDHEESVREGLVEHRLEVERTTSVFEAESAQVAVRTRKVEDRAVAAGDPRGANELRDASKPEPVVRRVEPVRAGDAECLGLELPAH